MPLLLLTGLPAQAHAQEAAVHTVRPGDTLTRISAARGVSVADLLRFNGLGLETVLYPGDELRLTGAAAPAPAAVSLSVVWWRQRARGPSGWVVRVCPVSVVTVRVPSGASW